MRYLIAFLHVLTAASLRAVTLETMAKRSRTSNDLFSVKDMVNDFRQYARLKDPPFDWECADYSKSRRSQAPDREGWHLGVPSFKIQNILTIFNFTLLKIIHFKASNC